MTTTQGLPHIVIDLPQKDTGFDAYGHLARVGPCGGFPIMPHMQGPSFALFSRSNQLLSVARDHVPSGLRG